MAAVAAVFAPSATRSPPPSVAERLEAFDAASTSRANTRDLSSTPTLQERLAAMGAVPALGTRPLPAATPDHTSRLSPTKSPAAAEMKRLNNNGSAAVVASPLKFDLTAASGPAATAAAAAAAASASSVVPRSPPKRLPRVGGSGNGKIRTSNGGGADNELAAALARRRGAIGE